MRLARRVARLIHGVQNAAVHRLQAVAHVGQGAGHDNGHGVFQEGGLHLLAEKRRAHRGALAAVGPLDDRAVGVGHVHHHRAGPLLLGNGVLLVQGGRGRGNLGILITLVVGVDPFSQVQRVLFGGLYLGPLVGVEVLVFKICHWFPFLKKRTGLVQEGEPGPVRSPFRAGPSPNAITAIAKTTHTNRYYPHIVAAEVEAIAYPSRSPGGAQRSANRPRLPLLTLTFS